MKKLFVNMKYTGLHKETNLISFAAVTEDGGYFYWFSTKPVNNEVDKHKEFIENEIDISKVIDSSFLELMNKTKLGFDIGREQVEPEYNLISYDDNPREPFDKFIESQKARLGMEDDEKFQVVLDVGHYDWILLHDLYGHGLELSDDIYYIPLDLATLLETKYGDSDISRLELVVERADELDVDMSGYIQVPRHALLDTLIMREVYNVVT